VRSPECSNIGTSRVGHRFGNYVLGATATVHDHSAGPLEHDRPSQDLEHDRLLVARDRAD
jgi:hypothetical protein